MIEAGAYYLTNRKNIFLNKTHAYRRKQLLIILFYLISGIYGIAIIGPEFASNIVVLHIGSQEEHEEVALRLKEGSI